MNSNAATMRVALLGVGIMGAGMGRRLLGAGFPLTVFNRKREKAAALAAAGARVADSPRAAAADADVVISMVAEDNAARAVWFGPDGALAGLRPGAIAVESSTVTVAWARELATAVEARGSGFLDAPVTGSKVQAAAGELIFLVGGKADVLERARPVLAAMSKTIAQVGPSGSGATIKLIHNFVAGVQVAAMAEAMAMIERSGLDRARAVEILLGASVGSPVTKLVAGRMMVPDYTPNFLLRLMAKDLSYAHAEAAKLGLDLATVPAASAVFQRAIAAGLGEKDMAAVVEPMRAAKGN